MTRWDLLLVVLVCCCLGCGSEARTCALGCTREGTCDLGLVCRRDVTGNYAFCL